MVPDNAHALTLLKRRDAEHVHLIRLLPYLGDDVLRNRRIVLPETDKAGQAGQPLNELRGHLLRVHAGEQVAWKERFRQLTPSAARVQGQIRVDASALQLALQEPLLPRFRVQHEPLCHGHRSLWRNARRHN